MVTRHRVTCSSTDLGKCQSYHIAKCHSSLIKVLPFREISFSTDLGMCHPFRLHVLE